jgi:hypothetical protein
MYVGIEKSNSENAIYVLRKCALRLTGIFYSNIFTQVPLQTDKIASICSVLNS